MHADSRAGEAHPVGHGASHEFSALWYRVPTGIRVAHLDISVRIVNPAIEGGALGGHLFQDREGPGGSRVPGPAGGNAGLSNFFVSAKEISRLLTQVDADPQRSADAVVRPVGILGSRGPLAELVDAHGTGLPQRSAVRRRGAGGQECQECGGGKKMR